MIVGYERAGGMQPPPDNEQLQIDEEGQFSLWRSIGWITSPPTPVGRFGGHVSPGLLAELKLAVAEANRTGNIRHIPEPGQPVETITAGATAEILDYVKLEPGWDTLAKLLRQLLGDLTAQPLAAVGLRLAPDKMSAKLVHLGKEPAKLDLSKLTLRADHLEQETYNVLEEWTAPRGLSQGVVEAGPGWSFDLPFNHNFKLETGTDVRVFTTFEVFDGELPVPVSLQSPD